MTKAFYIAFNFILYISQESVIEEGIRHTSKGEILICDAEYDGRRSRAFYKNGDLHLIQAEVKFTVSAGNVEVTSDKYVHAVNLTGGIFEDNYFSLLPGEVRKIKMLEKSGEVKAEAYTIKI